MNSHFSWLFWLSAADIGDSSFFVAKENVVGALWLSSSSAFSRGPIWRGLVKRKGALRPLHFGVFPNLLGSPKSGVFRTNSEGAQPCMV